MKTLTLGEKVKIKKGARVFYNLSANAFKKKKNSWAINQMTEQQAKQSKGCYTKKANYDGEVIVSDPEIVYLEGLRFCEVFVDDKRCHLLIEDTIKQNEKENELVPAKAWEIG